MHCFRNILVVLSLIMACFGSETLCAQDNSQHIGLFAFGAKIGYHSVEGLDAAYALGLHADCGTVYGDFVLFPGVSYWSKSETLTSYYSTYRVKYQELALNGDVHYYLNPDDNVNYYIGGGPALVLASGKVGGYESSETRLALNLLAGLEFPLAKRSVFLGEARYKIDRDVKTLSLSLGVSFDITN